MKNKYEKFIILIPLSILLVYFLIKTVFDDQLFGIRDYTFSVVFILLFIPLVYSFLLLYSKFLKLFSVNLSVLDIFGSLLLGVPLSTDVAKDKNFSFFRNLLGDIFINIVYFLFFIFIFAISFYITFKVSELIF